MADLAMIILIVGTALVILTILIGYIVVKKRRSDVYTLLASEMVKDISRDAEEGYKPKDRTHELNVLKLLQK